MKIPLLRPFQNAAVAEIERHSSSKRTDAGASPAGSANFKLPGSVKVARRPVKPRGVGASPTLAAILWKAGRYKLAAPVSKTGSVTTEVGALPTPSANSQTSTEGDQHDHSPTHTSVAADQMAESCSTEAQDRRQEGTTGPSGAAEAERPANSLAGRRW